MKTIKSKQEFERVFRGGKRVNHPAVRLTVRKTDDCGDGRLAFVAAKRLGNAVYRNRCKRVLRAAAREAEYPPAGYDVILFSTNLTHDSSSGDVAKALRKLAKRIKE